METKREAQNAAQNPLIYMGVMNYQVLISGYITALKCYPL